MDPAIVCRWKVFEPSSDKKSRTTNIYIYMYMCVCVYLYTSLCGFVYSIANAFQTAVVVLFLEHCFQENLRHIDCCSDSSTSSYFKQDIPFWALKTPKRVWISLLIPSSPDLADHDGSLCRKPFGVAGQNHGFNMSQTFVYKKSSIDHWPSPACRRGQAVSRSTFVAESLPCVSSYLGVVHGPAWCHHVHEWLDIDLGTWELGVCVVWVNDIQRYLKLS